MSQKIYPSLFEELFIEGINDSDRYVRLDCLKWAENLEDKSRLVDSFKNHVERTGNLSWQAVDFLASFDASWVVEFLNEDFYKNNPVEVLTIFSDLTSVTKLPRSYAYKKLERLLGATVDGPSKLLITRAMLSVSSMSDFSELLVQCQKMNP